MSQTVAECLQDLKMRFGDTFKKRKLLAKILQVSPQTIAAWMSGENSPRGESLLRLEAYLTFLGYDVIETQNRTVSLRGTANLIAFNVVTLEAVKNEIGITQKKTSHILGILRGEYTLTKEKDRILLGFIEKHKNALAVKIASMPRLVNLEASFAKKQKRASDAIGSTTSVQPPEEKYAHHGIPMSHEHLEKVSGAAADFVKALVPLMQLLIKGPAKHRERLRELSGRGAVFEAANLLNSLCSETALKANLRQNQK